MLALCRQLPFRTKALLAGSGAIIVSAIALKVLEQRSRSAAPATPPPPRRDFTHRRTASGSGSVAPSRSLPLTLSGITIDEAKLAADMRGKQKVVLTEVTIHRDDSEHACGHIEELELDQLYELPQLTCTTLTLRGHHPNLGDFLQKHRISKLRLIGWEGISSVIGMGLPEMAVSLFPTGGLPDYPALFQLIGEREISIFLPDLPDAFIAMCEGVPTESTCSVRLTTASILHNDAVRAAISNHHEKFERLEWPHVDGDEWPGFVKHPTSWVWSRS